MAYMGGRDASHLIQSIVSQGMANALRRIHELSRVCRVRFERAKRVIVLAGCGVIPKVNTPALTRVVPN